MRALSLWVGVALSCGCRAPAHDHPKPEASAQAVVVVSSPRSPHEALDELDGRRPLPLLPMMAQHQKQSMREHLEAVQQVVAAAATGDFVKVGAAAKSLGYSESMARMCEHMGVGAPGFTEQALSFHHAADEIAAAAAKHDGAAVLTALSKTLGACTNCHATYKQQLVASLPQ